MTTTVLVAINVLLAIGALTIVVVVFGAMWGAHCRQRGWSEGFDAGWNAREDVQRNRNAQD